MYEIHRKAGSLDASLNLANYVVRRVHDVLVTSGAQRLNRESRSNPVGPSTKY